MAIFFPFDIIEIDLFDECIIIVNTEFFKKWFPNLVDVANNDWRKKYFCQGNCHCVNCCNNLWKSKMWLMFNAFKKVLLSSQGFRHVRLETIYEVQRSVEQYVLFILINENPQMPTSKCTNFFWNITFHKLTFTQSTIHFSCRMKPNNGWYNAQKLNIRRS